MTTKTKKKMAISLLCVATMVLLGATLVMAAPQTEVTAEGGFSSIATFVAKILVVVETIGGLFVVGGFIFTGIMFARSSTSPEKKKLAYEGLIACIIAGIVVFGAWKFAGILKGEANKVTTTGSAAPIVTQIASQYVA